MVGPTSAGWFGNDAGGGVTGVAGRLAGGCSDSDMTTGAQNSG